LTDNDGAFMRPLSRSAPVSACLLAFLLAFLTFGVAAPARADDAASAREHRVKGTSYFDLGKYPEAIKEFEAAYQLKNDPALLYDLAQSNRLAGNSEQALRFYRTYLRYVPKVANRDKIEDRIRQLDQLVAQKNAAQTAPPTEAIPANEPAPGTTAPPPAAAPPPEPAPSAPEPAPGMTGPPSAAPGLGIYMGVPPAPPPDDHHRTILAGKITAAVGGVLFIVGAAYGAAAVGAANEVNSEATSGKPFDPSVEKSGKRDQQLEGVFITTGLLAGAAGGILYFYGHHLATKEASASLTPIASADQAGLSLRVIF
jgi:tetratricopeptide (TPR) repeat protein